MAGHPILEYPFGRYAKIRGSICARPELQSTFAPFLQVFDSGIVDLMRYGIVIVHLLVTLHYSHGICFFKMGGHLFRLTLECFRLAKVCCPAIPVPGAILSTPYGMRKD